MLGLHADNTNYGLEILDLRTDVIWLYVQDGLF
jgi:hypothetical protein